MQNIKVTHLGEDYATIEVNGEEYETSLGLGEAILAEQKKAEKLEHILKWIISEAWTLLEPREDEHAENWRSYGEQHAPDYIRAFTK